MLVFLIEVVELHQVDLTVQVLYHMYLHRQVYLVLPVHQVHRHMEALLYQVA